MVKNKDMQFIMKNLKRKRDKNSVTFQSGDLNSRFSVIFMENEGDEIKWKQASKRDRTLLEIFLITLKLEENANNFFLLQNTGMKPNTI